MASGYASAAGLGGVADPRLGHEADDIGTTRRRSAEVRAGVLSAPDGTNHYGDTSIPFESYHFWARRSREAEKHIPTSNAGYSGIINMILGKKSDAQIKADHTGAEITAVPLGEKEKEGAPGVASAGNVSPNEDRYGVTEEQWETAQRASRTATWGAVFYLITTDILGPYNVPWAISQMGYGPGMALYIAFGLMAYYSGMQLWKMFCGLDSTRYPMRNYGDLAFRVFGSSARLGVNILQSFQFFLNVVLLIESNGQGLAQMVAGPNNTGHICCECFENSFS